MLYLIVVSLLWAFSFGLVKGQLSDLNFVAISVVRLGLATLVFLPFLRMKGLPWRMRGRLMLIGAVQFGLMYMLYLGSFRYLRGYEVALSTTLTPLYIVLIDALLERRWHQRFLLAALLALAGAWIVLGNEPMTATRWTGFLMMQGANLCFSLGQLMWRRAHLQFEALKISDGQLFALPYFGAFLLSVISSLFLTDWPSFQPSLYQWVIIAHLGILASGLCFFWWNIGAERVNAGTLAVMNNGKLPLGLIVSVVIFGEETNLLLLLLGTVFMMGGIWAAEGRGKARTEAATKSTDVAQTSEQKTG